MIVFRSLISKQCVNIFKKKFYRENLEFTLSIYGFFYIGKCVKYACILLGWQLCFLFFLGGGCKMVFTKIGEHVHYQIRLKIE